VTTPRSGTGRGRRHPVPADDVVVRVEVHVRPRSAITAVGGTHGGVLVVRVTKAAHDGQANEEAVRAIAAALGLPRTSVVIESGATARRKRIGLHVPPGAVAHVQRCLHRLRAAEDGGD
jgi:uncharacterized protein YggU (UPF0235/DUF167 family)